MISKEERDKLEIDGRIYICYDYLFAISKDRILATHGGSISLITLQGEIICTYDSIYAPQYITGTHHDEEDNIDVADFDYVDDLLIFVDNNKKGIIDYDGEVVLEANYSDITFRTINEAELFP